MNPNTPRTNAMCDSIRKDGIDWHHSATHMAAFARALEIKLHQIEDEIEGYIDGAPDASAASKLANRIWLIISSPTL